MAQSIVGQAAAKLGRRFILIEQNPEYVAVIRDEAKYWLGHEAKHILTINCQPVDVSDVLF